MREKGAKVIEDFIRRYSEKGYRFALTLCSNHEEAKEMVQESFARVLSKWDQYDHEMPLENWFLAILRHLYSDGIRRYERRHAISLDYESNQDNGEASLADKLVDPNEVDLLDRLERQEESQLVQDALNSLVLEHKAVIVLCDMQGLTYDQAGEVLDCPSGTVRSRLSRARSALRRKIVEQNREVSPYAV